MTLILMHPGFLTREVKAITITAEAKKYYIQYFLMLYIYSDQCLLNNALINASETSLVGILSLITANAFCRMERNRTKGLNRIFEHLFC